MLVAPQVWGNGVRVDRPEVSSHLGDLRRPGFEEWAEQGIELRWLVEQQLEESELHGEGERTASGPAVGQDHDAQVRLGQESDLRGEAEGAPTVVDDGLAMVRAGGPAHRVVVTGLREEGRQTRLSRERHSRC